MRWQCMRTLPTRSSGCSSATITGVTAATSKWFFNRGADALVRARPPGRALIPSRTPYEPQSPAPAGAKLTIMDQSKLRAWWSHRQGLDGSLEGKSAAEVLGRVGWARSVGGV